MEGTPNLGKEKHSVHEIKITGRSEDPRYSGEERESAVQVLQKVKTSTG